MIRNFIKNIIDKLQNMVWRIFLEKQLEKVLDKSAEEMGIQRDYDWSSVINKVNSFQPEEISIKNADKTKFLYEEMEFIKKEMFEARKQIIDLNLGHMIYVDDTIQAGRGVEFGCNADWMTATPYLEGGKNLYLEKLACLYPNTMSGYMSEVNKAISIQEKGEKGEAMVARALELYQDKYKILQNIVIEANDSGGETSETDAYIITNKGVLVCEVKNYGNEKQKIHIGSDGKWTKLDVYNGRVLENMKSPIEQNTRHCLATERFLKKYLGKEIKMIPLVIIANNYVTVENYSRSTVIRSSELYTFIEGINNGMNLSWELQEEIYQTLNVNQLEAREFSVKTYRNHIPIMKEELNRIIPYLKYNNHVVSKISKKWNRSRVLARILLIIIGIIFIWVFRAPLEALFKIVLTIAAFIILALILGTSENNEKNW